MGTISKDPIGIEAGDPNFYRYVNNSPTNATDPSGLVGAASYIGLDGRYHNAWDPNDNSSPAQPRPTKGRNVPGDTAFPDGFSDVVREAFQFFTGADGKDGVRDKAVVVKDLAPANPTLVQDTGGSGKQGGRWEIFLKNAIAKGQYVGTSGSQTCVGVIICGTKDITVTHIRDLDREIATLRKFHIEKDARVYVFGGDETSDGSVEQLQNIVSYLRRRGADIRYSNTTGLFVDRNGNPFVDKDDAKKP